MSLSEKAKKAHDVREEKVAAEKKRQEEEKRKQDEVDAVAHAVRLFDVTSQDVSILPDIPHIKGVFLKVDDVTLLYANKAPDLPFFTVIEECPYCPSYSRTRVLKGGAIYINSSIESLSLLGYNLSKNTPPCLTCDNRSGY